MHTKSKLNINNILENPELPKILLETAQAIYLILDTNGNIVYFNSYMEEISGYKIDEIAGKDWFETFLPIENQKQTRNIFLTAINNIQTRGNIDIIKCKNNNELTIEWWDKTIKDASGNVLGLLSIGYNITNRIKIENDIMIRDQRLESLNMISQYPEDNLQSLLDLTLHEAIKLTNSQIGYINLYDQVQNTFNCISWSRDNTDKIYSRKKPPSFDIDKAGILNEVLHQKKPIILNNYQLSHSRDEDCFSDHVPFKNFLAIPVLMQNTIVATLAVANKPEDYTEADSMQLTLLMNGMWRHVERHQNKERMLDYQNKLKSLALQLSLSEEETQKKFSNLIHDEIAQDLAIIKMKLESLNQTPGNNTTTKSAVTQIMQITDEAIKHTRALMFELSPPLLHEFGLDNALELLTEQTQSRFKLTCTYLHEGNMPVLETKTRTIIFQSVRELIMNTVKHAKAKTVQLKTVCSDHDLSIIYEDDGIGFDLNALQNKAKGLYSGFGLFSMKERIEYIGGSVQVSSSIGSGTRVILTLPVNT